MTKIRKFKLLIVTLFLVTFCTTTLVACIDKDEVKEEPAQKDYPVAGVWCATATWHEDNPYNYGGDTYVLKVYFDFGKDGTLRNKRTLSLNGHIFTDSFTDWVIVNVTWSVKGNIITFSSGKQFVIVDDEFNDTYPNPKLVLHYKKVQ